MRFAELKKGRFVPGDCGYPRGSRPEWLDMDIFHRALEVYKNNVYSIMLAHSCGPILMGQVGTLALPVKFTGKSATVPLACRRLASTVHHVLAWYEGDIWNMEDYAYESVQQVRRMHGHVVDQMAKDSPPEKGHLWLSQYDMALTQFAFMGSIILNPEKVGMQCDESDMECLLHFWRGVGYLLGMEDRFNICAGNYQETKTLFQEIVDHVVFPTLSNPREEYQQLVSNGIEALKTHSPFMEYNSFYNFSYDLVGFQEKKSMSWYGMLCYFLRMMLIFLLPFGFIRRHTNTTAAVMLQEKSTKLRGCPNSAKKNVKKASSSSYSSYISFLSKVLLDCRQDLEG